LPVFVCTAGARGGPPVPWSDPHPHLELFMPFCLVFHPSCHYLLLPVLACLYFCHCTKCCSWWPYSVLVQPRPAFASFPLVC
jgi:hypothetical protein